LTVSPPSSVQESPKAHPRYPLTCTCENLLSLIIDHVFVARQDLHPIPYRARQSVLRNRASGDGATRVKGKTGRKAFMAISVLKGEPHSFIYDHESFFWTLFSICIHFHSPDKGRTVLRYEKWNYADIEELAEWKLGIVNDTAS
jgi:hypothetical protein